MTAIASLSAWTAGKGRPLVVVHPDGVPAGLALPEVAAARKAKRPVLVLGVFQTGPSVAPRKRTHNHWLTFNVSDDQARVHDIVAALATLPAGTSADVLATGAARYWAAVAVAAAGGAHTLAFDVQQSRGRRCRRWRRRVSSRASSASAACAPCSRLLGAGS